MYIALMIMKKHEFCFLYVKGQLVYIEPFRNAVKLMFLADADLLNKHRGLIKFVSSAYDIVLKLELTS